ncbi:MAG: hypothetical protein DRQ04_05665 [Candidatus Hydrothermota bacterium]|nr:MAG: hypothetical protein DRQ04_05665 [Candidatus Hydrothermae bacterium]
MLPRFFFNLWGLEAKLYPALLRPFTDPGDNRLCQREFFLLAEDEILSDMIPIQRILSFPLLAQNTLFPPFQFGTGFLIG